MKLKQRWNDILIRVLVPIVAKRLKFVIAGIERSVDDVLTHHIEPHGEAIRKQAREIVNIRKDLNEVVELIRATNTATVEEAVEKSLLRVKPPVERVTQLENEVAILRQQVKWLKDMRDQEVRAAKLRQMQTPWTGQDRT